MIFDRSYLSYLKSFFLNIGSSAQLLPKKISLIKYSFTTLQLSYDDIRVARVLKYKVSIMSDGAIFKYNKLAMQLIAMKGFKSYEDQLINNLSPHINIIIGRNGEGKSNFFKAINFVLTDRVPLNKTEYIAYNHRGLDNTAQPVAVETYFRSRSISAGDSSLFRIERIWHPDLREELRVEEHSYKKEDFENLLESVGISYSNSYHVVQQGRIDLITRMDDFELYNLLEDATGLKKYERRYEETTIMFRRNTAQKEQIGKMLEDVESKLKMYESRREEYQLHNYEDLANKLRSRQDYQHQLDANTEKLQEIKYQEGQLSEEAARLRNKAKQTREQLQQLQQDIIINEKQLYECQSNPEDDDLMQAPLASKHLQDINVRLKKAAEGRQRLKAEWERKNKDAEVARKEMEAYKDRFSALTSQMEGEKLAKTTKGKAEVRSTIDRLQQSFRQTEEDIRKMSSYLKEFKVQAGSKETQDAAKLKEELNQVQVNLKGAKIKMYEVNRVKNQLESEVEALEQQSAAYLSRLRKALPLLDLSLLRELQRQKIKGVFGYLLEFVEIDPSVIFAYEMAGAGRLCTLLVQEESVCSKVIEINRKLKGRQVNMLPLSVVRKQPNEKHNTPTAADCYSLLNQQWLRIRAHSYGEEFDRQVRKVLNNTFSKYMLVQSYELALDLSKRYHLNCITGDREVVYSEGYFCKVGRDQALEDRIQIYYKLKEKERLIGEAQTKLTESGLQLQTIQNAELVLIKKKVQLENDSAAVTKKLDEITYQKRAVSKVQQQLENLQRKKGGFEAELKRTQELLVAIEAKKVQSVNPKEYKELQQLYNERVRVFNQKNEEEYAVERQLNAIARQEEELAEQATKMRNQISLNQSFGTRYVNEKQYRQRLEFTLQEQQESALKLQKELFRVEEQVGEKQAADGQLLSQMALLVNEISYYEALIQELGDIDMSLQEVEERSNSLSMSFSHIHTKKRHYYTAKQKIFFTKIELYRQQLADKRKYFHQLVQEEAKLIQLLEECQIEKDRCVAQIFDKFQREFQIIFRTVTGGKTDVRMKKMQEKTRGVAKFRGSMSIRVSFEAERELTRWWGQFSGGQKSVLAFCVLMALQKCQPASFYVLDEFDAALDPIYLQRIVGLIRNESQRSQYFISTFKPDMLNFPDDICNYYIVEMRDRVSKIRRINQAQAKRVITSIIE